MFDHLKSALCLLKLKSITKSFIKKVFPIAVIQKMKYIQIFSGLSIRVCHNSMAESAEMMKKFIEHVEKSGEYLWIDLAGKIKMPHEKFYYTLRIADNAQKPVLVAVEKKWHLFFRNNRRPGLYVVEPETATFFLKENEIDSKCLKIKIKSEDLGNWKQFFCQPNNPNHKVNILYIGPWLINGGADAMTIDWFKILPNERYNKYFITTEPRDNTWLHKLKGQAVDIYDLPFLNCLTPKKIEKFLLMLISDLSIHYVHIMNSQIGFSLLPAIKLNHPEMTTVCQFHCFDYDENNKKIGYPKDIPRKYDQWTDFYQVPSNHLKREIKDMHPFVLPEKIRVFYCGVDCSFFHPRPDKEDVKKIKTQNLNILFIGRLDYQKQPLTMARIAAELKKKLPFVIHVLGDGGISSQKRQLENYIQKHHLAGYIKLHGWNPRETLVNWYNKAHILLMTSKWEGIPVVLYEAMAMELICIVPNVGGIPEICKEDNSFIVKESENISEYISIIKKVYENQDLIKIMGRKSRRYMLENFDLCHLRAKYYRFYRVDREVLQ